MKSTKLLMADHESILVALLILDERLSKMVLQRGCNNVGVI